MHAPALTAVAIVVLAALVCGMLLSRLRQPPIIGYIVAGIILGPSAAGLVTDRASIALLAELGVLLLLFVIGMQLNLRAFRAVYRQAVIAAVLQIAISVAVMLALRRLLDWPIGLAVLLGFVISLSSTAVAIKMLEDANETKTAAGRMVVGILIAQDLAVVPMLLILADMAESDGFDIGALLPAALAVLLLVLAVNRLSRATNFHLPLRRWVAGQRDLVLLAALGYCFAAAAISGLLGLTAAYGAFLAGVFVGSTTDRVRMMRAVEPIQSLLLMVFFLSIGLLIDLGYVVDNALSVFVLLVVVVVAKTALNIGILRLIGQTWADAFVGGVVLAQIGEFSFVLASAGAAMGLIAGADDRLAVVVIALSLLMSPLWVETMRRLHGFARARAATPEALLRALYGGEIRALGRGLGRVRGRVRRIGRRAPAEPAPEPVKSDDDAAT